MGKERILEILTIIAEDSEADAMKLDGQPLDGRTVGRNLGQVYAAIQALAKVVKADIESRAP